MRRRNRLRIIQIVRRKGAISRGEIAQQAALSPATVSTISNDLIAEGVLVARGSDNAAKHRPRPAEHRPVDQSASAAMPSCSFSRSARSMSPLSTTPARSSPARSSNSTWQASTATRFAKA
jgi:predicted ArsR family transcriptional regulator